jgi:hypothetical protein
MPGYRSIDELADDLSRLKVTYDTEDLYAKYEAHGAKLNFRLLNSGEEYLNDASITLSFQAIEGIEVAAKIHRKHSGIVLVNHLDFQQFSKRSSYPDVSLTDGYYHITQYIGNIRHHILEEVVVNPIRLSISRGLAGRKINMLCKIFAENLTVPLEQTLDLEVAS